MTSRALRHDLVALLSEAAVLTAPSDCWAYAYDNSRQHVLPDAVVFPQTTEEVQAIIRFANTHHLPIIPRGRGTGTPGGSVPVPRGIVISTEKMDQILCFRPEDRYAIVQPGVINQTLQNLVGEAGFFWPPDPSSAATCTIGGNLAYNSAGPRAVKYGTPRENTLGLTAITGTGERLVTGCKTTKGVVGYDLTRLLIGSEGTLAFITEATLKLHPLPEAVATLQLWYRSTEGATSAIAALMAQPIVPCAVEWMDARSVALVRENTDLPVPEAAKALVMLEIDGARDYLEQALHTVQKVAQNADCLLAHLAKSKAERDRLWTARKSLSPLLKNIAPKKINEDIVVPVSRIPELVAGLENLSAESGIPIVNFGHAGNGNIHVNLLVNPEDALEMEHVAPTLRAVFDLVLRLEGTLSGEHGIGIEKKPYIDLELSTLHLELMRKIKQNFDPHGILNPNKIFEN